MIHPGYTLLSQFEIGLIILLVVFILIKKDRLITIVIGLKAILHQLIFADLFWRVSPWPETMGMYYFAMMKQIVYVILLIWMIYCERRGSYKKVCLGIAVLFSMELFFSFVYYPQFINYFYNECLYCNTEMSVGTSKLLVSVIASAPFDSISKRLMVTFVEMVLFSIQVIIHRGNKMELKEERFAGSEIS